MNTFDAIRTVLVRESTGKWWFSPQQSVLSLYFPASVLGWCWFQCSCDSCLAHEVSVVAAASTE